MPSRTGYTFEGYFDAETNGTKYYNADGTSAKNWDKDEDTILYAHWRANTYTIKYNQGTASSTSNLPSEQTATYDQNISLATNSMTKSNTDVCTVTFVYGNGDSNTTSKVTRSYSADGWSTTSVGSKAYNNGASVSNLAASETFNLYPYFSSSNNNASFPSDPSRTGYEFEGWYNGTTQYTSYNGNSDITLTAKWTANTYTVTLSAEDATTAGTASVTATYDSAMPSITRPSRTGYTFQGYYTSTGGGGTQYYDANVASVRAYDMAGNTTLYAYWTVEIYTITLDNQDAITAGTTTIYEKYESGYYTNSEATVEMTTSANGITVPTKVGYTFGGYYTSTDGKGTQYIDANGKLTNSASTTNFAGAGKLYAKWTGNVYTITLDNQSANTAGTTAIYEKYGTGYYTNAGATTEMTTSENAITIPTRDRYEFLGYYTQVNGGGTQYIDASGKLTSSASTTNFLARGTLYANWESSYAQYVDGKTFNTAIKRLAGTTSATYSTADSNITEIAKSSTAPTGNLSTAIKASDTTNGISTSSIVDVSCNEVPIYAWYDSGTIKLYSRKNTVLLNADASYMFSDLKKLSSVNLNVSNTSNVTNMDRTFYYAGYNATTLNLDLSNWDMSHVTNMPYMLYRAGYYASTLSLDLSNWDISSATALNYAFDQVGYRATTVSLDLSSWDTSNITDMSSMFSIRYIRKCRLLCKNI